jgi:hypothetical protein
VAAGGCHVVGDGLCDFDSGRDVGVKVVAQLVGIRLQDRPPARPADTEKKIVDTTEQSQRLSNHAAPFAGPR